MTTQKARLTIYLAQPSELEDLREQLRILAPLELRGRISGSTCVEASVALALADVKARGRQSAIYEALVTHGDVTHPLEAQP